MEEGYTCWVNYSFLYAFSLVNEVANLMDKIIHIQIPQSIVEKQPQKWYTGPKESDIFWPKYKKYLQFIVSA